MKSLFNRIVAFVCAMSCGIMMVGSFSQALAVEEESLSAEICRNISQYIETGLARSALHVDKDKVQGDIENLENLGILYSSEQLQSIVTDADVYGYELQLGNYVNLIEVDRTEADRTTYNVYQGEIHNELIVYDNCRVLLDGKEVLPAKSNIRVERANVDGQTFWNYKPEYGEKDDYKYKFNTEQNADVKLTQAISAIAVGTFTTILGIAITGTTVGAGVGLLGLLATVYDALAPQDPTSTAVSYKAIVYTTKSGSGYVNTTYGYCYRYDFTFYSQKNFQRFTHTDTAYKRIQTY